MAADELLDALVQTSFVVTATLTRIGAAEDLSLTQLRVLAILRDRRVRMSSLADHLGLERSSLSGLVDRAERRGLVAREPSASDGRAVEVALTEAGAALAARLYTEVDAWLGARTAVLSAAEQQRLQLLLRRVLDAPAASAAYPSTR